MIITGDPMKTEFMFYNSSPVDGLFLREVGKNTPSPGYIFNDVRGINVVHFIFSGSGSAMGQPVHAPCAVLLPAGKRQFYSVNGSEGQQSWRQYWIMLDGAHSGEILCDMGFSDNAPVAALCDPEKAEADFKEFFELNEPYRGEYAALRLLFGLVSRQRGGRTAPEKHALSYAESAKLFIDRCYSRHITGDDIAACARISAKHLYRLFKSRYGVTPGKYLFSVRMNAGEQLLIHTGLSVRQIAEMTGFCDQNYFSQVFRRVHSSPPSVWRREHRKISDGEAQKS